MEVEIRLDVVDLGFTDHRAGAVLIELEDHHPLIVSQRADELGGGLSHLVHRLHSGEDRRDVLGVDERVLAGRNEVGETRRRFDLHDHPASRFEDDRVVVLPSGALQRFGLEPQRQRQPCPMGSRHGERRLHEVPRRMLFVQPRVKVLTQQLPRGRHEE